MNSQTSNTNVLLLIIPNPSSTILPHSLFYRLFSAQGEVAKILIFEKARIWKAFVEMGNDFQARNAQLNLNGIEVSEGITMNVYFSNLKTVTFLNNNCGGVDYRQLKHKNAEKKKLIQQQEDQQFWFQGNSQPEIAYQANFYQQTQTNPMYHSYPNVRNEEDFNDNQLNLANQQFMSNFKSASTIGQQLRPSDSWLPLKVQADDRGTIRQLKRKTSLENIADNSAQESTFYQSQQISEKKTSNAYSEFTLPPMTSSNQLLLSKIKEEEDYTETPTKDYHQDKTSQLQRKLHEPVQFDDVKTVDRGKYVEEPKQEQEKPDSQSESNSLEAQEMLKKDYHDQHEELSPDGQKMMKAFTSPSNYMFSLHSMHDNSQKGLQQSSSDKNDKTFDLEQEMNAQLNALDISDFQSLFQPPPNLDQINLPNSQPGSQTKIANTSEDIVDPSNYVNPQFLIENQPSKVIYIRGLQHPSLSPINIFNLLSNCGNVMVIIYIKQKSSALVQFEKLSQAQNAKDHLNNMPFFEQKLKIFYSNYQQIQFPLPYQSPQTMIYIPCKDQFRFGDGKSISFNPPSQTLHLSNIKIEVTESEDHIIQLFKGIGTIQAIKFMHLNQSKHMVLVKLSSIEEAMNGAALLHGKELFGRKINVSFTKSKF